LGIDGVKIHSLYVLQETPLARLLEGGGFSVLGQEAYVDWVVAFLANLPPTVVIQRLTGDPDPSALVAPAWTLEKQKTLALIQQKLDDSDSWQGKSLNPDASARIFNI
jgi:radical SAM superfamily enzyme